MVDLTSKKTIVEIEAYYTAVCISTNTQAVAMPTKDAVRLAIGVPLFVNGIKMRMPNATAENIACMIYLFCNPELPNPFK